MTDIAKWRKSFVDGENINILNDVNSYTTAVSWVDKELPDEDSIVIAQKAFSLFSGLIPNEDGVFELKAKETKTIEMTFNVDHLSSSDITVYAHVTKVKDRAFVELISWGNDERHMMIDFWENFKQYLPVDDMKLTA